MTTPPSLGLDLVMLHMFDLGDTALLMQDALVESRSLLHCQMRDVNGDFLAEECIDLLQRETLGLGPVHPDSHNHHKGSDGKDNVELPPNVGERCGRGAGEDDRGEEQATDGQRRPARP